MQKLKNNRAVFFILTLLGIAYFVGIIFQHKSFLFRPYDSVKTETQYNQSQWQQSQNISPDKVLDEWALQRKYTGWKNYVDENEKKLNTEKVKEQIIADIRNKGISDSLLYTYVGYRYSLGANPSLLNPEHPPLAKYLIGYSIHLFGSEHVIGIGIAFLSLFLVGLITYQLHKSLFLSGAAIFLTAVFPLFTDQIIHGPQLELYQLFFFLLFLSLILFWTEQKKYIYIIFAGLVFGLLLSTKTLLPFLCLFSTWLLFSLWKQWKALIIIFMLGAFTFAATYYVYFLGGGTFRTFLGLQKYIITYYGNSHIPLVEFLGNYLRLIYTGSWKFWDSARTVSHYQGWNLLWPVVFTAGLWPMKDWSKNNAACKILISFLILYNIFVFVTPIFPRYLLLLFVPTIILI